MRIYIPRSQCGDFPECHDDGVDCGCVPDVHTEDCSLIHCSDECESPTTADGQKKF